MKNGFILSLTLLMILAGCSKPKVWTSAEIDAYWTTGKTLPSEVLKQYPLPPQPVVDDKGYNVLIDMAHECSFNTLWTLPEQLNQGGYRAIGSHATIHTVLNPEGESRIRMVYDTVNQIHPFVWMPNPDFQLIITRQTSTESQEYLPEELEAMRAFLNDGGGILVQGRSAMERVSKGLNVEKQLSESDHFEVGEGRMWFDISTDSVPPSALQWLAGNKKPMKDQPCYPEPMWGGGGIYPELEDNFNNIVFYWAANQKAELLKTVTEDVPKAQSFIEERLPSKPTAEPMYLILCSGGGGGWAVNAYRPKENGIISLDSHGILSIFGHELAHTMHGPVNDLGEVAGISPIPNRGEAHAGWFQGKVNALFKPELLNESNRNCNSMFTFDPTGSALDLATHYENQALTDKWGKGKDWVKTWYLWQKLDDRYGPSWYPTWKYVQHTRWQNDPEHQLTWDEMVEDMSIAVGEDLFPFFRMAGTSLKKDRLAEITYRGQTLQLEVAPIDLTPAGNVRMEGIGNYKK